MLAYGMSILQAAPLSKENANARSQIVKDGLRPHPSVVAWEGHAVHEYGHIVMLSGRMQTQMARMILEGYWDDAIVTPE